MICWRNPWRTYCNHRVGKVSVTSLEAFWGTPIVFFCEFSGGLMRGMPGGLFRGFTEKYLKDIL